jgi:4-hydroxy-tetrahydrodipicolinate reductase
VIRVGVVGATGRMGREVCRAVAADPDLILAAAVSHSSAGSSLADAIGLDGAAGDVVLVERLDEMGAADVGVLVDFTAPANAPDHVAWGIANGVHVVVGTTGFEIDPAWNDAPVGVVVAPNFAIGAVLLMRFAEQAARHLPSAEVIELHHDGKVDAPSGTALLTARRIAAARGPSHPVPAADGGRTGARGADVDGVRVHSVRLPGLVAHEEVIFGGPGQILTLRHDSTDRTSFVPGVLLAVKAVGGRPGLTVGLEPLLEPTPELPSPEAGQAP